jgi:hypothetical protein
MWPFATRGSRFLGDAAARHPSRLSAAHFARNDAVIKLWLPEKLLAAVDVLCAEHEASRPDVLRWILFEHVQDRPRGPPALPRQIDRGPEAHAPGGIEAGARGPGRAGRRIPV